MILILFIILIIISIILYIISTKQQPHNKKKVSRFENKFEQIHDNLIKEAKDNYNNIYNRISSNNEPINCNKTLYWIKDNIFYSIIQRDAYINNIEKKLVQQKYNVVYNSKIPEINFTYDEIPVNNIKYFTKEGDIQNNTVVSGGGGGGLSISGAIVGGLIAGEAGAIIGGRKKIEEIKSEIVKNDNRKTILKYYENNHIISKEYDYQAFNVFEKLIPNKEYNIVIQDEIQKNTNFKSENTNIEDSLKKLKNLRENDLINESEYQQKKKELLDTL